MFKTIAVFDKSWQALLSRGEGTIAVTWTAAGINLTYECALQSSDSITGPYMDVVGASSPAEIPFVGTSRFFRTRQ